MGENLHKTEFKESFGEVNTPYSLADEMISLFPEEFFIDPNNKWLDPGCGGGNISWRLFNKLLKYHKPNYILKEMIQMVEINKEREKDVKKLFKKYTVPPVLSITNYLQWIPEGEINGIICNPNELNNIGGARMPPNSNEFNNNGGICLQQIDDNKQNELNSIRGGPIPPTSNALRHIDNNKII